MAELPRGTVTLVFSDIEGSTRLLASLGSRYEAVLADHRRLLREALSSHGGIEVDTQGDALFYAFPRAQDAVTAAIEAPEPLVSLLSRHLVLDQGGVYSPSPLRSWVDPLESRLPAPMLWRSPGSSTFLTRPSTRGGIGTEVPWIVDGSGDLDHVRVSFEVVSHAQLLARRPFEFAEGVDFGATERRPGEV